MQLKNKIAQAEALIRKHTLKTPVVFSPYLSQLNKGQVYLKLESEQHTGSFKARGALNKVLCLSKKEKDNGLVTASTGNHALGFARAVSISGDVGEIYLPKNAAPSKIEALKEWGAKLHFYGTSCLETELHAKKIAKQENKVWVSPYNDVQVMAGQGTIGVEISQQLPEVEAILACIGGGGMIGGIAGWYNTFNPSTQIIGCLPENAPEMLLSIKQGKVVALDQPMETLSDGSAGGLEENSITFSICQELIKEFALVSENEIANAIQLIVNKHHKIIEGAAGVAVGAFINMAKQLQGKQVVIVICGCNISTEKLTTILSNEYTI